MQSRLIDLKCARRGLVRGFLVLAGALFLGWGAAAHGQIQVSREYQLKAVFLFNFAQFTDWPTNAFPATNSPIIIGVLGVDPFGAFLDETVKGEVLKGRRIAVERYRRIEEAGSCQILYIARSEARQLKSIVTALSGKPVLTVSDIEDAAESGAMVELVTESNRIRLKINLDAVKAAALTISSKLLRVAQVVPPV